MSVELSDDILSKTQLNSVLLKLFEDDERSQIYCGQLTISSLRSDAENHIAVKLVNFL